MNKSEQDAIILHVLFTIICGAVLLFFSHIPMGRCLLCLVTIYNILVPTWAVVRKHGDWINLWVFCLILSVFQVFPDWFLSAQLDILVFPADGCFKIGTVSGYMAGLWTIPLFVIIFLGHRIGSRLHERAALLVVGAASLILFGGSEAFLWLLPSWYAKNVRMIGHIAVYILIPEVILGVSAYACFQTIKEKSHWLKIPSAFLVMLLYLGSAAFFYFLIEKIIPAA